jgi:hypothetical protein
MRASASTSSSSCAISAQGAVSTPASLRKRFSAARSWATRSASPDGRTGFRPDRKSTVSTGTFSNSSVITSTAPAKASSAPRSSQSAAVWRATSPAGQAPPGSNTWQR